MADEFEPGGGFRAIGIIKAGSRYMYAAFASISMDAIDAVALNRDEDCMMLRREALCCRFLVASHLVFFDEKVKSAVLGSRAARVLRPW